MLKQAAGKPYRDVASGVPTLLTPAELSQRLRISEHTLANWRAVGQGPPYVKLGGKIRYRDFDVDEWIESLVRRTDNNANKKSTRDVALSLLAGRPRIHGKHRLGRHRTQQDRRDQSGGEGAGTRDEWTRPRADAPNQTVQ